MSQRKSQYLPVSVKFGQTNTLSEIKPHHQLVYCVQLLGTIARGNFSCNLTRTEVNLTTGTFLGFIASLARSRIKASFLQQMATL